MQVLFRPMIDQPWLDMAPVVLGEVPPGRDTPDTYVLVSDGETPLLRADVYTRDGHLGFSEAAVWRGWLVIGFEARCYLVRLSDKLLSTLSFPRFFCHLYPGDDYLLLTSASQVVRIEPDGVMLWASEAVGVDGVVVTDFDVERIHGEGEGDPPGGGRAFIVDARTGQRIEIK